MTVLRSRLSVSAFGTRGRLDPNAGRGSDEGDRMFRRAGPTRSRTHTRHMDDMYTKS